METLHLVTRAFCTACILGGITLRLLEGTSSRGCIKAIVGLYILVVVIRALQNAGGPAGTAMAAAALPNAATVSVSAPNYEDAVLHQSCAALEQTVEQALQEQGIRVIVRLELSGGSSGVRVETARVQNAAPSDREAIEEYLCSALQAETVVFENEG